MLQSNLAAPCKVPGLGAHPSAHKERQISIFDSGRELCPKLACLCEEWQTLFWVCRYVFPDEAAASASEEGRSSEYVVARSEEDALQDAQSRHASTSHQHRLSCTACT